MRKMVIVLACLASAGCTAPPHIVNSTPDGVSFAFSGDEIHQASAAANTYCDQLKKFGTLQSVGPVGDETVAVFACD